MCLLSEVTNYITGYRRSYSRAGRACIFPAYYSVNLNHGTRPPLGILGVFLRLLFILSNVN